MIEAVGLTKHFEDFVAVRDLHLEVPNGELLALLGPNGAGKTTTVRMLGAILRPTEGTAQVNGYDVVRDAGMVRRTVGVLTEQPGLYLRMSGLDYLAFFGRIYGLPERELRQRILDLFEGFAMKGMAERRLGIYSKGMRQKVGLIRCMLHDPAVLLLDEPTSAMDPHSAKLVRDAIRGLRADRRSIIICTHNLAEAEALADRIAIISRGSIVCKGTAEELKQQVLGPPLLEVQLDKSLDGDLDLLDDMVNVETIGEKVIRYRTETPEVTNPQIVHRLTDVGFGVVSLRHVPQSLEDVYLSVLDQAGDTRH